MHATYRKPTDLMPSRKVGTDGQWVKRTRELSGPVIITHPAQRSTSNTPSPSLRSKS